MAFVRAMICRDARSKQVDRSSPALSSPTSIEETFVREAEELRWLAASILGGEQCVEECIADAVRIAQCGRSVSPDWIKSWVQRATARAAASRVIPQISRCVENHVYVLDADVVVPALGPEGKSALRSVRAERIRTHCDALERAALLLHGYLGYAVQDCALLLGCHRLAIVSSCSSAVAAIFHGSPAGLAEDGGIACVA